MHLFFNEESHESQLWVLVLLWVVFWLQDLKFKGGGILSEFAFGCKYFDNFLVSYSVEIAASKSVINGKC